MPEGDYKDPREEDIVYEDRRISRPDSRLPDWYVSDTQYRPIPIVWFAGALVLQVIAQPLIVAVALSGIGLPRLLVFMLCLIASYAILHFTFMRGMADAASGWKWATSLMLVFFLGISGVGLLA